MSYPETAKIKALVQSAKKIVIVQADNPDADSLGTALALETILGDLGKEPLLYCGVEIPGYLRYLQGWDRVEQELPSQFEVSIIVDASTTTLLEKLRSTGQQSRLAARPCIVLDHHATVDNLIPYASILLNDEKSSSTGELIYHLSQELGWKPSIPAQAFLMTAILGDTQGLSNQLARAATFRVIANMVEAGVDRPHIEELRREFGKMPAAIFKYKARLIEHTDFSDDGRIATVTVPQDEINAFSPLYNPGPLVQGDMLQTSGVLVAIVFKHYNDGKVTAAIRCNHGAGIAGQLAQHFGGGGHDYASGFKITSGRSFNEVKSECIGLASTLLANSEQEQHNEALQHPN